MKELNFKQKRWLEQLKDYDINILHHQGKVNIVSISLSRLSLRSTSDVEEEERELDKDVHIIACLESDSWIPQKEG